jgi:hypothetical protein
MYPLFAAALLSLAPPIEVEITQVDFYSGDPARELVPVSARHEASGRVFTADRDGTLLLPTAGEYTFFGHSAFCFLAEETFRIIDDGKPVELELKVGCE